MGRLSIRLFGRFDAGYEECSGCVTRSLKGLEARKPQECFSYLLLHRNRMLPREVLAELLTPDIPTEQSRKGLRQVLWQLQSALSLTGSSSSPGPLHDDSPLGSGGADATAQDRVLVVDADWVYVNPYSDLWLDVAEIDDAFQGVIGQPGETLSRETAERIRSAVAVYRGDLLEGWYYDWCLLERERLQSAYLALLDKLMAFSATRREYEAGLVYGQIILAHDRARERTHQRMMELHSLAGDRTGALRQYHACVAALQEELGVAPSQRTTELYERIATGEASAAHTSTAPAYHPYHLPSATSDPRRNSNRTGSTLPKDNTPGSTKTRETVDDRLKSSFNDLVQIQFQFSRRVTELGHLLDLDFPRTPSEASD